MSIEREPDVNFTNVFGGDGKYQILSHESTTHGHIADGFFCSQFLTLATHFFPNASGGGRQSPGSSRVGQPEAHSGVCRTEGARSLPVQCQEWRCRRYRRLSGDRVGCNVILTWAILGRVLCGRLCV
jgi:hypothetical protein